MTAIGPQQSPQGAFSVLVVQLGILLLILPCIDKCFECGRLSSLCSLCSSAGKKESSML
eukprot:CAMPEP_0181232980 /NCGR_PEP_ID=MMETSP1096-20121128/36065_1 /TAXON_ID=156174 ORGANISM="Chrysochromulina ericina, Strain CCMP281" /NCGR_SAMPLE_ID=MMETSP1096 /ASSEMBLY_ACC=CAM_ASM_000453 /LENGTH=58 /DNA_ID=CAMNT_0023327397 /DNA_START=74 /DNA_END=250 /DNA_ORIENTATION=-